MYVVILDILLTPQLLQEVPGILYTTQSGMWIRQGRPQVLVAAPSRSNTTRFFLSELYLEVHVMFRHYH